MGLTLELEVKTGTHFTILSLLRGFSLCVGISGFGVGVGWGLSDTVLLTYSMHILKLILFHSYEGILVEPWNKLRQFTYGKLFLSVN